MHCKRAGFFGLLILALAGCGRSPDLKVVDGGHSAYTILTATEADSTVQRAAVLLHETIASMTGAKLPVVTAAAGDSVIVLAVDSTLTGDGFALHREDARITLSGGSSRGVYVAVAQLLEQWGCRMLAPGALHVPRRATLRVGPLRMESAPAFAYREVLMPNAQDRDYAAWHGLHNRSDRARQWGLYVHTFDDLVPPSIYFEAHPEYFTSLGGLRVDDAQLCLSNEAVFDIVVSELKQRMAARPEAQYWSVSQNDTYSPCGCDACRALDEQYGGPSGTLLWFVNRVAREFPDKTISTLAYQYTRRAPENIVPEPNVNIMLCTIECDRSRPLSDQRGKGAFVHDLKDWAGLTSNIYLWDYVVQFRSYFNPFPNLRVLQPNLKFFEDHSLQMMFQQGSGTSLSEFHNLRTYVIAKLLWNPDVDVEALIDDFLLHFYGAAAPPLRVYINALHDSLSAADGRLGIYGTPWDGLESYLTPAAMEHYAGLLHEAALAVQDDSLLSRRVQFARLPLEYAILENAKQAPRKDLKWFSRDDKKLFLNQAMTRRFRVFVDAAKAQGVKRLHERGLSPYDYENETLNYIRRGVEAHEALGCAVTLAHAPSEKYPAGGAAGLSDGLRGPDDYHCNWLGFEGEPIEAVVDLGRIVPVHRVAMDFLQDEMAWIFLPDSMQVSFSLDGETWQAAAMATRQADLETRGAFIENFDSRFDLVLARYVRVKVHRALTCPAWHKGAGGKAWAFCDEIVVQ